ncbi:MAG: Rossmann-like and DUF2520 domain-containing protein [Pseudomonadota bacterium]
MKILNVIGAGRVGRTLAALWANHSIFSIQGVLDATLEGAHAAVTFIGAGTAADEVRSMRAAHVWMLTTPDSRIRSACEALAACGVLRHGDVVFHCSGALGADELSAAAQLGASTASVHPLKTFADPAIARRTFAGTYCASEGDAGALDVLTPAFEAIGARVSRIEAQYKTLYHAASVIVCNDLVALIEAGLRCYEQAGLSRATSLAMIAPIVRDTIQNVLDLGTTRALTGPIARGDEDVVARQVEALSASQPQLANIYRDLGVIAVELAREQGGAREEALTRIEALLTR